MMFETVLPIIGPTYRVHQQLEALLKKPHSEEPRRYLYTRTEGGVVLRHPEPVEIAGAEWKAVSAPKRGSIRFFLRVIPMIKRGAREGRARQRIVLNEPAAQREWLADRFAKNGMEIGDTIISDYMTHVDAPGGRFVKTGIDVLGIAKIKNSALFHDALLNGIGEGKPYGFGNLIILEK